MKNTIGFSFWCEGAYQRNKLLSTKRQLCLPLVVDRSFARRNFHRNIRWFKARLVRLFKFVSELYLIFD